MDECDPQPVVQAPRRPGRRSLSLSQPEIILTSPLDSPGIIEMDSEGRMEHLESSMDKLSRKLIQESLETVAVIRQYSDKIPPIVGEDEAVRCIQEQTGDDRWSD